MKKYGVLYSFPTWDRYFRSQRSEVIEAMSQRDAIARIRRGLGKYGPCPQATVVRCREVA